MTLRRALAGRVREVVVVADFDCPACSEVARELPDLLVVPVRVRACRDPHLADELPTVPAAARTCRRPALGLVGRRGTVRWWPGLSGAAAVAPLVRRGGLREAAAVLLTALRARRA